MNVSVIGLGKLGACMMVSLASKGFKVVGVEIDKTRAELLKQGKTFHYEPNLNEYLNKYRSNITITDDYNEAISNSDVTFIVVNTPSDSSGAFSVEYLAPACKQIGEALRKKSGYHLVSVTSTIMPGTTRNVVQHALESTSQKKVGKDFGLCYNPEFIALGSVIHDFLNPDFILIGESDAKAGELLSSIYTKLIKDPKIRRMSYENAEITKIALNSYITMKISFANLLAEMCNRIPGADVDTITDSLGMDTRIGKKYLKGAMSFGGPCFAPGTLVQTLEGLKKIEEIHVNDLVLTHEGKYHRVTEIFRRHYEGDMIEIVPQGFSSFSVVATHEHPMWSAKRIYVNSSRFIQTINRAYDVYKRKPMRLGYMTGHARLSFIPILELQQGDLLSLPRIVPQAQDNTAVVPEIEYLQRYHKQIQVIKMSPKLMYMVGWSLAEGFTSEGDTIEFCMNRKEAEFAKELFEIFQETFGVKLSEHKVDCMNGIRCRVKSRSLTKWFDETIGKLASGKHIPYSWLSLPDGHLIELLRGMWYGDGSNSGNEWNWASVSLELANFMHLALLRLLIPHSFRLARSWIGKDGVRHRTAYFISSTNEKMNWLLPKLKLNSTNSRKTIWVEGNDMFYHIRDKRIIKDYSGDVFNLEVEGANSYMLASAVAHNCFPRDNKAFFLSAKMYGCELDLPATTDKVNRKHIEFIANMAISYCKGNGRVAILGGSYKPNTDVIEASPSIDIAKYIVSSGIKVSIHDPVAIKNIRKQYNNTFHCTEAISECLEGSDVCIITTPWEEYKVLSENDFKKMKGSVVIDCWRIVKPLPKTSKLKLVQIGVGS